MLYSEGKIEHCVFSSYENAYISILFLPYVFYVFGINLKKIKKMLYQYFLCGSE